MDSKWQNGGKGMFQSPELQAQELWIEDSGKKERGRE